MLRPEKGYDPLQAAIDLVGQEKFEAGVIGLATVRM
jgi:hypothetical protein